MDTRSCAHHTCDQEFTTKYPTKKYCSDRCQRNAANARYFKTKKGKVALKKSQARGDFKTYRKDYYYNVTAPKGQRLQERLDNLFRAQAAVDPSGLPELASRILLWRPKGYVEVVKYALHPYGPLEVNWLYYADYTPEEAVVVYERED